MNNKFGLRFRHLGMAVRSPEKAKSFLEALGYTIGGGVEDPSQKVHVQEATHPSMPTIEVVSPSGEGDSPIESVLKKGNGLIYHTCYASTDREGSLNKIRENGFQVIEVSAPQPAALFGGKSVSFYMVHGFGLIEILEE